MNDNLLNADYGVNESSNLNLMGSLKLFTNEKMSIGKLIFTHVASFIVGATL